jgi:putative FmdB family regulatory protein
MPLYEYYCKDCRDTFEKMVRFSDADKPVVCPSCESTETRKIISLFASSGFITGTSGLSGGSSCGSSSGGGFS